MEALGDEIWLEENISANAIRNNGFEKYSRFHGKTDGLSELSNSTKTKLSNCVREFVYRISPDNIACIYKKLFETSALNTLRSLELGLDDQEDGSRSPSPVKVRNVYSELIFPRGKEMYMVNKSNSCVYTSSLELQNRPKRGDIDDICRWDVCDPDSATCLGHTDQRSGSQDEVREPSRRHGKPRCYSVEYSRPLSNTLRSLRQNCSPISNTSSPDLAGPRKITRDRQDDSSSVNSIPKCLQKSPIKVGKYFRHFRRNTHYIDQYREEYTYKKLRDLIRPTSCDTPFCRCGSPNCSSSCSTPSMPTWFPTQSQVFRRMSLPCDMSTMPATKKRTLRVIRRRPQMHNYGKQETSQFDKPFSALVKEVAKVEFYSAMLTVNDYNPTTTAKQSKTVRRLGDTKCDLSLSLARRARQSMTSSNLAASERFIQNKNERGQQSKP